MATRRLRWVTRDAGIIMGARAIHTFIQGVMAVTLGVYLVELGFSLAGVGLFFSLGFASTGLLSLVSTFASERIGRRGLLLVFTGFTIAGGIALLVTGNPAMLLAFGFIGSFTGAPGNVGPTQSLEQAALAGVVDPAHRTDLFALYRITATTASALGALAAGIPVLLQSMGGIEELASFRIVFGVLVVLRLAVGALFMFLSDQVEAGQAYRGAWVNPMKLPSRRTIFALTGLFSLDHLSGSIVVQGLLAVWFKQQFGLDLGELAVLFFSTQVFAVGSLWVAAKIANRIGADQYDDVGAPAVGAVPDSGGVRAVGVACGDIPAAAVAVRADGRSGAGFVHHGRGGASRAGCDGEHPRGGAFGGGDGGADAVDGCATGDLVQCAADRFRVGEDGLYRLAVPAVSRTCIRRRSGLAQKRGLRARRKRRSERERQNFYFPLISDHSCRWGKVRVLGASGVARSGGTFNSVAFGCIPLHFLSSEPSSSSSPSREKGPEPSRERRVLGA